MDSPQVECLKGMLCAEHDVRHTLIASESASPWLFKEEVLLGCAWGYSGAFGVSYPHVVRGMFQSY